MKRALSLLLTLAMVMSFFTVGAFAATATVAATTGNPTTIVVGGVTELGVTTHDLPNTSSEAIKYTYTPTYKWTIAPVGESLAGGLAAYSADTSDKFSVYGAAPGTYKVTCTVTLVGAPKAGVTGLASTDIPPVEPFSSDINITVVADNYAMQLVSGKEAQEMNLAVGDQETVTSGLAKLHTKAEGTTPATPVATGVTYVYSSTDKNIATVDERTGEVTAVKGGITTINLSAIYMGKTYPAFAVCTVTVTSMDIEASVTNGSIYTGFAADVLAKVNAAAGKTTANAYRVTDLSGLKLTVPAAAANSIFTAYRGTVAASSKLTAGVQNAIDLTQSNPLIIEAKAGSINAEAETWAYEVWAGGVKYTGYLLLKSLYGTTITATQYADFTREWFYLDDFSSYGTAIRYVRPYPGANYSTSFEDMKSANQPYAEQLSTYKIYPYTSSPAYWHTANWTENLIGYTAAGVAYLVNVDFVAANYDMTVYAEDADAPFVFSEFEKFVDGINAAHGSTYYGECYDVQLEYVTFEKVKETNNWEMKLGSTTVPTYGNNTKLTANLLNSVTFNILKAGIYDIPFTAYAYQKTSSTGSWSTYSYPYYGVIRVNAAAEGNIVYEVSYSESVTFDVEDFQSFYKTATGKANAVLQYVTFTEGQPEYGVLRSTPAVVGNYSSLVSASDTYYADPQGATLADLDKVTYTAAANPKTQYSVYIPFTAYGTATGATALQYGVVEIIVNGELPFVDITKTHTFYDYIKYVYREGIMNGKTSSTFDAKSNVTRLQLVRTLYRMAGSPTTYDYKTISFTDAKTLTGEAASALKWAVNTGLVNGYGNVFKPNDPVTRQAMVTILYRFANYYGYDTMTFDDYSLASFSDAGKVSKSMRDAMNWAVDYGFVSGNGGKLNPGGSTTRGACAKILAGFHDWYID